MNQPKSLDSNFSRVEVFTHDEIEKLKETYPAFTQNVEDFAVPLDEIYNEIALSPDNLDPDLSLAVPNDIKTKLIVSIIFEQLGFDPNNVELDHEEGDTKFFKTNNEHILLYFNGDVWVLKHKEDSEYPGLQTKTLRDDQRPSPQR